VIAAVRGEVLDIALDHVVIEAAGVGYKVMTTPATLASLRRGDEARLVTAMIYAFILAWNDFLFALSFIKAQTKMPLTLGIYQFVGRWSTQWEMLTVAAFVALIPVLVLFYLIEKELVSGLAGGAVKG